MAEEKKEYYEKREAELPKRLVENFAYIHNLMKKNAEKLGKPAPTAEEVLEQLAEQAEAAES